MTATYICYEPKNFQAESLKLLRVIDHITNDYERQGYSLTVRQCYYQLVSRNIIPNSERAYNNVQRLISEGRLAGLISWTAYEDRGRNLMGLQKQISPPAAIKRIRDNYRIDKWATQRFRPEVWVEKAALEGVVGEMCNKLQVDFFACRGFNSTSEQWNAGQRFARYVSKGQTPIVIHLGDHDPSGVDMTRDNRERLQMFAGVPVQVVRIALNMPQIELYSPPPNPLKVGEDGKFTDSRAKAYYEQYGESSWELDALEPSVIQDLIDDAVRGFREEDKWEQQLRIEAEHLQELDLVIEQMGGGE